MLKTKLCGFAIAFMVGFLGFSPIAAAAAETNSESVTLSEKKNDQKDQKDKRAAFEEKMKQAREKWNTLTAKQKNEVYTLLENEMMIEKQVLDKLVEFGVMDKNDANNLVNRMTQNYNKAKESGEFPFFKQKTAHKH